VILLDNGDFEDILSIKRIRHTAYLY